MKIKLNVGCGGTQPLGWVNTDSSLNIVFQANAVTRWLWRKVHKSVEYRKPNARFLSLASKWPFDNRSVDIVYGSHVFEHLSVTTADHFLSEAMRVLKPGGVIRLVVPDLETLSRRYLEAVQQGDEQAAIRFLSIVNMHLDNAYQNEPRLKKIVSWFQGWPHQHKFMYDRHSLRKVLRDGGFVSAAEMQYGASAYIKEILEVEYTSEGVPAIYVEALKP
jgi:predicted SAM-dependent methyltransferase